MFKSTNSGQTYSPKHNAPNIIGKSSTGNDDYDHADYDLAMAVSPSDEDKVITGAVRVWYSSNGGSVFDYSSTQPHGDIHDLAYNPLNNVLYACTDGGVFKSYDDGDTWTAMFNGFATSQMYHMRGTVLHSDYFIAGLQDNGVKTRDYDGTFWLHKHGGDGFDVSFFPTTTDKYFTTINNRLYRFDDTLANITPNQDENGQYQWFGTVVTHYTNPDILFAGYTEIWRSTDRGETWTDIGGEGSWAMAACQSNHNRFYAAGSNDGFDG